MAGDLAHLAATNMIARMARYPGMVEALFAGWDALQRELGYETATPLERLLIESVVLAWMRYHDVEMMYTRALSENHALELGVYWEKRVSAAQGRYLRAMETLARVRRLACQRLACQREEAMPGVQVHVTQQQVSLIGQQRVEVEDERVLLAEAPDERALRCGRRG